MNTIVNANVCLVKPNDDTYNDTLKDSVTALVSTLVTIVREGMHKP